MKSFTSLMVAGLLAAFLVGIAIANAAEKPPVIALKPDIILKDLKITKVSSTPTSDNVQISVTAINTIPGTRTGPFKIKVEWTENPTLGYNFLATAGVANLINDPSSIVVRGETRTFNHVVPKGKAYKYLVTADYLNQVLEASETNNQASAGYVAR